MLRKRGELTTQQIVILVILIVSFAVILIFLFFLDLGEQTDSQICRDSVVLRSNSVLPSDSVPLKCNTQYLCISQDNSCESMTNPKIEKVEDKEDVYRVLGERMVDCWWMFGEGTLDYVGEELVKDRYCSICYTIGFDESVKEIVGGNLIDKNEFYRYLAKTNIPGKKYTYTEYLLGTSEVPNTYTDTSGQQVTMSSDEFGNIDMRKQQNIITFMDSKISFLGWGAIGGAIVGTFLVAGTVTIGTGGGAAAPATIAAITVLKKIMPFANGILKTIPSTTGTGGAVGTYVGTMVNGKSGNNYLSPNVVEADDKIFKVLNCSQINTLA